MQLVSGTLLSILNAIKATGAPFDPAATFVGLMTGVTNRGLATALSDLTLAPGTLATAIAVTTWGSDYWLSSGYPVVDGAAKVFAAASGADDCDPVGWYWADAATAGNLISFGLFDTVKRVQFSPLKKVTVVPRLVVSDNGQWDATVAWNG